MHRKACLGSQALPSHQFQQWPQSSAVLAQGVGPQVDANFLAVLSRNFVLFLIAEHSPHKG